MDTAFTDIAFQNVVFIRIKEADKVNAVLADRLETAENENPSRTSRFHKVGKLVNPIMIGNADHFNSGLFAGGDDGSIVGGFSS